MVHLRSRDEGWLLMANWADIRSLTNALWTRAGVSVFLIAAKRTASRNRPCRPSKDLLHKFFLFVRPSVPLSRTCRNSHKHRIESLTTAQTLVSVNQCSWAICMVPTSGAFVVRLFSTTDTVRNKLSYF